MRNEYYHNIKTTSLTDRESFNNTVLLLTMIKSQYYYIVGFSRPDNVIEIAFDFESDLHGPVTEFMTMYFNESEDYLVLRCSIKNLPEQIVEEKKMLFSGNGKITFNKDGLEYVHTLQKDRVIPLSTEKINNFIMESKNEVVDFLENQYIDYLSL